MKIIFVGNTNLKFSGLRHFGYDTRIFNGLVRNNHCVYFFGDRDEARQNSLLGMKAVGQRRANQKLLRVVDNIRPEALVLAHADIIYPETLQEIRQKYPDLRIAQINVDPLFNPKNVTNLQRRQAVVDATFITTGGAALNQLASPSNPCYFIPNFTDSSIDTGTAFAQEQPKYDLACFMHINMAKPADEADRLALANGVAAAISDLRICYGGFNNTPSIRGHVYIDSLGQSAMGLSLSKHTSDGLSSTPETRYLYSSDRVAHVMGNGCLAFVENDFNLDLIYDSDEVVFFSGLPALIDKVRFFKNNPAARQAIAKKGWQKAHEQFNGTTIIKYVLERLMDTPLSQNYAWPTEGYHGSDKTGITWKSAG